MIIPKDIRTIEVGGNFKSIQFGIEDPRIVMEYMRKSMYSNPIKAICQEIMSNGRDAHREAGTPDRAIEVKLPNRLFPTWECRDYGIGISPDRMKNVFTKFGKSTKNGANLETGGFGVGAKVPWSYSDVFHIKTAAREGKTVMFRSYLALIGEDRNCNLMEIEGDAQDLGKNGQTGTTIIVDVQAKDIPSFANWTIQVAKFWEVKPILSGSDEADAVTWPEYKTLFSGTGWRICKDSQSYHQESYAIVDGIMYPINTQSLHEHLSEDARRMLNAGIVLTFGNGEVSLALSRENIQYDQRTIALFVTRLEGSVTELRASLSQEIANAKNLWDAVIMWSSVKNRLGDTVLNTVEWQGIKVPMRGYIAVSNDCMVTRIVRNDDMTGIRYKRNMNSIEISDKTMFFLHDPLKEARPSRLRAESVLDAHPDLEQIEILEYKTPNAEQEMEKVYHISKYAPHSLLEYPKKKKAKMPKGVAASVAPGSTEITAWEFTPSDRGWSRRNHIRNMWESVKVEPETDEGIYVVLEPSERFTRHTMNQLRPICQALGIKVTAFNSKQVPLLGDEWITLREYAAIELAKEIKKPEFIDSLNHLMNNDNSWHRHFSYLSEKGSYSPVKMKDILAGITDKDSYIAKWIEESIKALGNDNGVYNAEKMTTIGTYMGIHDIVNKVVNVEYRGPLSVMMNKVVENFKMLSVLNDYGFKSNMVSDMLLYINSKNEALRQAGILPSAEELKPFSASLDFSKLPTDVKIGGEDAEGDSEEGAAEEMAEAV